MLYRVAICDDSDRDVQNIDNYLLRFSVESDVEFNIDKFFCGEELLEAYRQTKKQYDIIFLDMEMSGLSGINTAENIRCIPDRDVLIVFITSYPEYMQDSFDVQASQYLIKPLSYEIFQEKLNKLLCYLDELEINIKVISMKSEEIILHIGDIICFETEKSSTAKSILTVTTINGEFKIKGKIADFEKELKKKYFISIHRSVLVNMKYVKRFSQSLEFITGKKVEISRRKIPEVKEAFSKYMVMRYKR